MALVRGYELRGYDDLVRKMKQVGAPKKLIITRSARAGIAQPYADAVADAPKKTGLLKKGLKKYLEKTKKNKRYKSVMRLRFDPKLEDDFRKPIKRPGLYGGKKPTGYYPFSMEYGFKRKYDRRPGEYFIKNAIEKNEKDSLQKVVDVLSDEINRIITSP
jgi:hypothetical protein